MKLGVFSFNSDYGMRPDDMARAAEERGYDSFWVGEHTHIPASRKTPYPAGGDLPDTYWRMRDPFLSLMAAAAATKTIKLGTGVCLVIERDPIVLAKEVATLDQLSNGRFLFGVGAGWNAEEMENHGTPFNRRYRVLRERIAAMKAIWTEEEASYSGEFVKFERIWSYPKPVQKPWPPILLGMATAKGRQRVAEYGDGWIPIAGRGEALEGAIKDLRAKVEAAGRDPTTLPISIFCMQRPSEQDLDRYRALGIERAVLFTANKDESKALRFLDDFAPEATRAAE